MIRKSLTLLVLAGFAVACAGKKEQKLTIKTAPVERRTIVVAAEATGVIEPINVVEVKSRSSGQVTEMPVETGTLVRPGDLIVQLDTRDVQNGFDQSRADLDAAEKKLQVSEIQKKRSDDLFAAKIITAQENETAQLDYANAASAIVRSRASLDLAQQRLDDARVTAPVMGTIIEKPVALGQVIQSGTSTAGGGTTIVKMADLTKVRARALVNETDIGQVRPGFEATVTVDAFPDRQFRGTVEKIEPQAVVQQNVTMFPVLVSLDNREGLLMPGMNGEVAIVAERRENVLTIPNEAIRSVREAAQAAALLGLDADSVQAQIRASMGGGFGGGAGMGRAPGTPPANNTMGATGGRPRQVPVSVPGFVDLQQGGGQGGGRQGGGFGGQLPDVTDAQCKAIATARTAKPAAAKKVDDLSAKMRDPNADRQTLMTDLRAAYTELGVDMQVVRACRAREGNGAAPAGSSPGAGAPMGAPAGAATGARQAASASARAPGAGRNGGGARTASRSGLVFVQKADGGWEPRVVRLGTADYDFTEVLSGLEEGEQVALLSAAALQAQRQQNNDRMKAMTGGASPLGGATPGAGAGGGRPPGR
ncbi:MAG: efflux RND transporter periplasmic adaptor subunit [Gemmatimonadetes bacterium]|nr:efflux RND transporter periplasmic adaptor subunit [Gemmatimonadota bacterium]